jgi:hypothetical protein
VESGFPERSCSNKKLDRDADPTHPAPGPARARLRDFLRFWWSRGPPKAREKPRIVKRIEKRCSSCPQTTLRTGAKFRTGGGSWLIALSNSIVWRPQRPPRTEERARRRHDHKGGLTSSGVFHAAQSADNASACFTRRLAVHPVHRDVARPSPVQWSSWKPDPARTNLLRLSSVRPSCGRNDESGVLAGRVSLYRQRLSSRSLFAAALRWPLRYCTARICPTLAMAR